MQIGRATRRVVTCEQHERGEQITCMELLVVGRRDDALTGRGAGLQARQVTDRFAVEAQHGIATGDGARTHHDQTPAELAQDSSLIGQPADKARLTLPSAPTTVDEPIFTTIVL